MRKLYLRREDFELFHQDINPMEYEYYRSHSGAFQRMWKEQVLVGSACDSTPYLLGVLAGGLALGGRVCVTVMGCP